MKIKNENEVMPLPNDMDKECIELSNLLNRLPGVRTIESCMGHGKHPYWLFFQCMDINTLSRLSRAVCDRYSDGNWEIMCDSGDGEPRGRFWLRTIKILDIDTLNKSIKELMENIEYWFQDEFDDYFENGYKNINGEYVAEQNLDYYGNPLSKLSDSAYTSNRDVIEFADKYSHTVWENLMDKFKKNENYSIGCNDVSDIVLNAIINTYNWLERQGEQKTITFNNAHIIDHALNDYCCKQYDALHKENGGVLSFARLQHLAMDIYGWCCKEYLQGEQKPADSYCQENCKGFQETGKCFADGECKAKRESDQKPEENKGNIGGISSNWSEEDEKEMAAIEHHLNNCGASITSILWLKSLKDRKGGKI